jgi:hypothetical protein
LHKMQISALAGSWKYSFVDCGLCGGASDVGGEAGSAMNWAIV